MSKNAKTSALELERKYKTSERVNGILEQKLLRKGFKHDVTSIITDTLLPAPKGETHRIRREQIIDGAPSAVIFMDTRKTHPIIDGDHVRQEDEEQISVTEADKRIAAATEKSGESLPSYSKRRKTYVGEHKGFRFTIAFDHAQGLGRYSGHYVEIEVVLPLNSRKKVRRVQREIVRFAKELLGGNPRPVMSYRKMLLAFYYGRRAVKRRLHRVPSAPAKK